MATKKGKLKKKLDRLIQQIYVSENPNCYVCGGQTSEMHHYIQKSQSLYLRWNKKNLIPLCKSCHYKHHRTGDPHIVETIVRKKGSKWVSWINENRRKVFKDNLTNLRKIKQKLEEVER